MVCRLYAVSNDKIKEGNWFINYDSAKRIDNVYDSVHKCLKIKGNIITSFEEQIKDEFTIEEKFCKKVIAVTDNRLKIKTVSLHGKAFLEISLPQFSQQFLLDFINRYNKGEIYAKALVITNEPCCKCDTSEKMLNCHNNVGDIEGSCSAPNPNNDFYGLYPKVNQIDNTIEIKLVDHANNI